MKDQKGYPKGIILAGERGAGFTPITRAISKQLLPIYDKPMIYYPPLHLDVGGDSGHPPISTPEDIGNSERVLGDGHQIGLSIQYAVQPRPGGLAQAFLIGREFIGTSSVGLILGDNIFHGQGFQSMLARARSAQAGATVFAYQVRDPERYGVVEFDAQGTPSRSKRSPHGRVLAVCGDGALFL